jgi:type I restriction enzyme M protein
LFKVTQSFSEAPLDPETVDNHGMGTIFEYLIRKFKEASNEAAGQFYTPREIIRLMVKLLFEPDRRKLGREKLVGIYDPACGTGGMLTVARQGISAFGDQSRSRSVRLRARNQREDLRHCQSGHDDEGRESR